MQAVLRAPLNKSLDFMGGKHCFPNTDMSDKHNLDDLVALRHQKRAELRKLGQDIAASARECIVLFVDLSDSTRIKSELPAEEWLGYVYGFVQTVAEHALSEGGVVVKRIGDEVMLTFADAAAGERFIDRLIADEDMQSYRFKVAADGGEAFYFQFAKGLSPDPYGPVIDRCARIASTAAAGTVLCSSAYRDRLSSPKHYTELGMFSLKGLATPERLYVRPVVPAAGSNYLNPLLAVLNAKSAQFTGYRSQSRHVTAREIQQLKDGYNAPRPFLARELFNVPRLPLTSTEIVNAIRESKDPDKESRYIGYVVEWNGKFEEFRRNTDDLTVNVCMSSDLRDYARLRMTHESLEIVRDLRPDDRVCFRGIITEISLGFTLNYVELLQIERAAG